MQRRRRLWVIIGLVVVVLATCLWWFGGDRARTTSARRDASPYLAANVEPRHEPVPELGALNYAHQAVVPLARVEPRPPNTDTNISHNTPLLAYRVKNTEKP